MQARGYLISRGIELSAVGKDRDFKLLYYHF